MCQALGFDREYVDVEICVESIYSNQWNFISESINNHTPGKFWDKMACLFPNFDDHVHYVDVWEWLRWIPTKK